MINLVSDDEPEAYDAVLVEPEACDPVAKRSRIEFDSDDECCGSKDSFANLPSMAFMFMILTLTAQAGLRLAQSSRYLLGRWHNCMHGPRAAVLHARAQGYALCKQVASECTAQYLGLTAWGVHVMNRVQVPDVIFRIMEVVWEAVGRIQNLQSAEFFCGEKAVTNGMRKRGARVRGYDIRHDDVYQSLNTDFGFLTALAWYPDVFVYCDVPIETERETNYF
jgi:hypothetical protein